MPKTITKFREGNIERVAESPPTHVNLEKIPRALSTRKFMKLALDLGPLESIASPNFAGQPVGSVISSLLKIIFPIAGFALLLYLLYGGFQLMTSGGDPKKIQDAKSKITYALVGFLIVFTAFWLAQFFGLILGIPDVYNLFGV